MSKSLLVAIDGSYLIYHSIYRAIRIWTSNYKNESRPYLELNYNNEQNNLIDSSTFKTILYDSFLHTCYMVNDIIENNFPQFIGFDSKGYATILFCEDDFTSNGFRRKLYPEYKAGRLESKARLPYDMNKIRNYLTTIVFSQSDIWNRTGYKRVFVEGAEADDIIYEAMTKYRDSFENKIVISADKDLLQIPDVLQFNLKDQLVSRKLKNEMLTVGDFLLQKIILGDESDNIPKIFNAKIGPVKAYKIIKENKLEAMLQNDEEARKQYELNSKLIDISKMPVELSTKIQTTLDKIIKGDVFDADIDESVFGDPMML